MLLTFEVLKLVKSNDSIEIQESNIFDISVTWEVSKSLKSISTIFDSPENILLQFINGSFQINSIMLFSWSNLTLFFSQFTSFPSIKTWSGEFLKDLFKMYWSPASDNLNRIIEVVSRFLNFTIFLFATIDGK